MRSVAGAEDCFEVHLHVWQSIRIHAASHVQEDGGVSATLREEIDAVRRWRAAQEALESERDKRETLDVEVRKLRARVQHLEAVAGTVEAECRLREAQAVELSKLSQKLHALQQENDALKVAAAVPGDERPVEARAPAAQAEPQLQQCIESAADEQSVR